MEDASKWHVTRSEQTVRVDLTRAANLSKAETSAMLGAAEDLLGHGRVTVLELDVPESSRWTHGGLIWVFHALDQLATRYGKRLVVGPI